MYQYNVDDLWSPSHLFAKDNKILVLRDAEIPSRLSKFMKSIEPGFLLGRDEIFPVILL